MKRPRLLFYTAFHRVEALQSKKGFCITCSFKIQPFFCFSEEEEDDSNVCATVRPRVLCGSLFAHAPRSPTHHASSSSVAFFSSALSPLVESHECGTRRTAAPCKVVSALSVLSLSLCETRLTGAFMWIDTLYLFTVFVFCRLWRPLLHKSPAHLARRWLATLCISLFKFKALFICDARMSTG